MPRIFVKFCLEVVVVVVAVEFEEGDGEEDDDDAICLSGPRPLAEIETRRLGPPPPPPLAGPLVAPLCCWSTWSLKVASTTIVLRFRCLSASSNRLLSVVVVVVLC